MQYAMLKLLLAIFWIMLIIGKVTAQPLFYITCLADEAKLTNCQNTNQIAKPATFSDAVIKTPIPNSVCSAQAAFLVHQIPGLNRHAVETALKAYANAREQGLAKKQVLTLVDFTKPSNMKRLWVFDLEHNQLVFKTYVAHGTQSGTLYASRFSDADESHKSVLGVILTGSPYVGTFGYSLYLYGLEKGFNTNIFNRRIVMHPATYVTPRFIQHFREAGESFGCLAVDNHIAPNIINYIKDGSIIVNYYPSRRWLEHSKFLQ